MGYIKFANLRKRRRDARQSARSRPEIIHGNEGLLCHDDFLINVICNTRTQELIRQFTLPFSSRISD